MIDVKIIRQNPELIKKACRDKGFFDLEKRIDEFIKLDKEKREILTQIEKINAQKNKASRIIKEKGKEKKLIEELRALDKTYENLKKKLNEKEEALKEILFLIPNIPLDDVPVGKDEKDNVVIREVGERPRFDFVPKDHLELGEKLNLIDVKRAAKVSGTRFGYLKNEAVLIEFALIQLAFENLLEEGFIPILPPVMIKPEILRGMGYIEQLDKEEAYYLEKDKLYLVGTAEHSIGPYFANEILREKDLPRRFIGFSTCFRREAGSWGKDTRGIFRVHQFDKIEIFSFCHPEKSKTEHEYFLSLEEKLMKVLEIPYRVVKICTGDLGRPAAAKYDIEAWIPSQNRYRETHSTSNCTDFQTRRLNIRYQDRSGKLKFPHTVNGTVFAIGRTLIAILENYQTKDGSVKIPKALQKYLPFKEIKR